VEALAFNIVMPLGRSLDDSNEVVHIDVPVGQQFAKMLGAERPVSA